MLNALAIIVYFKERSLRKRSMYLVINQAVADMFVAASLIFEFLLGGHICELWTVNRITHSNHFLIAIIVLYTVSPSASLINLESETLHHLFFYCSYSNLFWKSFEKYYFTISKLFKILNLQDIIIGITASSCPLLNYLILIGKIHIWDCRRKGVRPNLEGFKFKTKIKYQTEKYIATKNNDLETFYRKWTDNFPL